MEPCLIIPVLLVVVAAAFFLYLHQKETNQEKEFVALYKAKDFTQLDSFYEKVVKGNATPPLRLGIRRLVYLISQNANPQDINTLGRGLLQRHKFFTRKALFAFAREMNYTDEARLTDCFINFELLNLTDIMVGEILKDAAPEFLRSFVDKTAYGISLAAKYGDLSNSQGEALYETATHVSIGMAANVETHASQRAVSKPVFRWSGEDAIEICIESDIHPGEIITDYSRLISAFAMGVPQVHAFMRNLGSVGVQNLFHRQLAYQNKTLDAELRDLLDRKHLNLLTGTLLFINNHFAGFTINSLKVKLRERIPVYWREKQTKDHLIRYTEHQYYVHYLDCAVTATLDFSYPAELLKQNNLNLIFDKLRKELPGHITFSVN